MPIGGRAVLVVGKAESRICSWMTLPFQGRMWDMVSIYI